MTVLVIVIVLVALLAAGLGIAVWLLLRQLGVQRAEIASLETETGVLRSMPAARVAGAGPRRVITVEILNALEVASEQSRVAQVASSMSPSFVTKLVYDKAAEQLATGLASEGVRAEVRVHVSTDESAAAAEGQWRPSTDSLKLGQETVIKLGQGTVNGLANGLSAAVREAVRASRKAMNPEQE